MIAVNPFAKLPHLYNEHMMEQYKGVRLGELSPHVFAVADASYRWDSRSILCALWFPLVIYELLISLAYVTDNYGAHLVIEL